MHLQQLSWLPISSSCSYFQGVGENGDCENNRARLATLNSLDTVDNRLILQPLLQFPCSVRGVSPAYAYSVAIGKTLQKRGYSAADHLERPNLPTEAHFEEGLRVTALPQHGDIADGVVLL